MATPHATTDPIPGTNESYNSHWASTKGMLKNTLVPRSQLTLEALTRVEATLKTVLAVLDGVDEKTVTGVTASVLAAVKEQIMAMAPALTDAVAARLNGITAETLHDAIDGAMREVFGSLDQPPAGG